jgi:hypothetical protein
MSITQNINNNTQNGTSQEITAFAGGATLTNHQGYFLIGGLCLSLTLIGIVLIIVIGKLTQTCILKLNFISKKQREELKREILEELKNS